MVLIYNGLTMANYIYLKTEKLSPELVLILKEKQT